MKEKQKQKENEVLFTPYIYEVELGENAEISDTGFIVYYNGEKKLVTSQVVRFHQDGRRMTLVEAAERFRGTKGIVGVRGYFEADISREELKELIKDSKKDKEDKGESKE